MENIREPVEPWVENGDQGKNTTSSILVSEYETVHGRILAVNMAHIRKKRQTAEQEGQDDNVFHKINEANSGE